MTDLRTLISNEEKEMMYDYITQFATDGNDHIDTDTFLRCWNTAKNDHLYKLLGNQFKVSKTLTYNKPMDKLSDEIYSKLSNRGTASFEFNRRFDRFLWENRLTLGDEYYKLQSLMSVEYLVNTKYDGEDFSVNTPDGKVIKVQKGARPMRIISRVTKAYGGIEGMEDFQNEVSVILTQKKLTGTMTLSIHPMDYMTMSHNDMGWSSCMDWTDEGCYRRGTVEMMNSDCVLVAYLASDDDMSFYAARKRYTWNNKKWRELFIVTENGVITGIKGYPYQNADLVQAINSWIAELAAENLGWKFNDVGNKEYEPRRYFTYGDKDVKLTFETNTMYNDFGTTRHFCILADNLDETDVYTNYSGAEMCLRCGSTDAYFDGEGCLVCQDCDTHYYCNDCGDRLREDDVYWLDGNAFCESCYENHATTDALDEDEVHDYNNMTDVYLVPDGTPADEAYDCLSRRYFSTYYLNDRVWRRWFNSDVKEAHKGWNSRYYVTPSMFKDLDNFEELFYGEDLADYLFIEDNLPEDEDILED